MNFENLVKVDEEIYNLVGKELEREQEGIELIASENFASKAVMEAMGSYLTNKYAEGYPAKRYYGGCQVVDEVEELARERAKTSYYRGGITKFKCKTSISKYNFNGYGRSYNFQNSFFAI